MSRHVPIPKNGDAQDKKPEGTQVSTRGTQTRAEAQAHTGQSASARGSRPQAADPLAMLTPDQRAELAIARRSARSVGLWVPLGLTAIGTVVTAAWVPRMPDPTATHWAWDGTPDAFGAPWVNVLLAAGLGLLLTALFAVQSLATRARGVPRGAAIWSPMHRLVPAIVLAVVTLVEVMAIVTAWAQLDLNDASEARVSGWQFLLFLGVALAVGLVGFIVQPKLSIAGAAAVTAAPLELALDERAVWFGMVRTGAAAAWGLGLGTAALVTVGVVLLMLGNPVAWIMLAAALLVFALSATTLRFRVRVDRAGMEVRSVVGWPVFRVPAAEIVRTEVVQVNPYAEWGGWGIRQVPGGFGVVIRGGEAIEVARANGRRFVVTVDDAATGASLLAAIARVANESGADDDA